GFFNQIINSDFYFTQEEYSNRTGGTCVQKNTFPQPKASFTVSASPTHGKPVTFKSTVSDTDDHTFTYSWTFGDGTVSTLASPSHTYATAGAKIVTLVVIDP